MQQVSEQLRNFLQYVAVQFIDHPEKAQLRVAQVGPKRLRFKLILDSSDVALLIGRNGFTASAIRSVLKSAADREGIQVTLQIHSHEEEAEQMTREDAHEESRQESPGEEESHREPSDAEESTESGEKTAD